MRFLVFLLCIYILLKVFRGNRPAKGSKNARANFGQASSAKTYSQSSPVLVDEMKKCPSCGTYNSVSLALRKGSDFFCNEKCVK